jgi:hypothetical protein
MESKSTKAPKRVWVSHSQEAPLVFTRLNTFLSGRGGSDLVWMTIVIDALNDKERHYRVVGL